MERELRASDNEVGDTSAEGANGMTSLEIILLGVELEFQQ